MPKSSLISVYLPQFPNPNSHAFSEIPACHHSGLVSLSALFRRYGFPPTEFPDFLKKNEFLLNSSPSEIEKSFKILLSLKSSQDFLISIVSAAIRNVLDISMKFALSPNDVYGRVKCLKGLGFSEETINKGIGLFPGVLAFGVDNRLKPLVDEFEDLGFSSSEIRREVLRDPKVLGLENGELSQCLEMLRSLKCRVVLWKEPRVILYEIEHIEKKIEFLVRQMKFDVQCLVEVPEYLGLNFDKQIIPRFNVIQYLQANDGLGDEVGLRNLVKLSRLRFYNMYVKPYPECEKIYGRFAGDVAVRTRHPVGMWKLFKPQQHPQSGEDVKNIKSYMESLP
ncbi:Transcription termination factor MT, mitochondrial [Sesamum angolense]|uniref:Transcription termination factor MT, mitochondrial n=1 Tax=Sesamum angolense TaxID=2727404 RepID=A0AAE1W0C5_9LAMI|nr:Transcription termination factor MT, mitochondrial [Sesamum angolense]